MIEDLGRDIDEIRLDRLSDPKFVFGYSIKADGSVALTAPTSAFLKDLRSAIDYARCHAGEMPFCIKCQFPLNESHYYGTKKRMFCPRCETAFNV